MSTSEGGEEREKQLEKQLEEAMEQLKAKDGELKIKDGELQKERDEGRERERQLEKTKEELSKEREERMAEKRELEKLRRQTPGKIGCVDEGSKKWEVEVEKICDTYVFSDYTYIGGVPFRIGCRTEMVSGTKDFAVSIRCNDKAPTTTFSASVDYMLTLDSTTTPIVETGHYIYTSPIVGRGWCEGNIAWADAVDSSKGYVKDGRITIEAKIKLICFYKNAFYDFSSPDPQLTDVTLIVGGMKFNICKKHIAIYSDFFKTLFLSDFAEKNKKRVELPEVDAQEFKDLLRMIHPQRNTTVGHLLKSMIHPQRRKTTVTKDNVEYLLRLSDYFIVDAVRWQCIDFMKETTAFPAAAKLQLTEQYRLPELQADVLGKMTTRETVKGVIDSDEFKSYSVDLKNYVFQMYHNLL